MTEYNFKEGDLVKIKPEWCDCVEETYNIYVICKDSMNEVTKRCLIRPVTGKSSKLCIVPTQLVGLNMLLPRYYNIQNDTK